MSTKKYISRYEKKKKVRRIKSLIKSKKFYLDKFEYKNLTSNFVSKKWKE